MVMTYLTSLALIIGRAGGGGGGGGGRSGGSGGGRVGGGSGVGGSGGGGGLGGFFLLPFLLGGGGLLLTIILIVVIVAVVRSRRRAAAGPGTGAGAGSAAFAGHPGPGAATATPGTAEASAAEGWEAHGGTSAAQGGTPAAQGGAPAAQAYDDTHPVGVPASMRGEMLGGSDAAAAGTGAGGAGGLQEIQAHDPQFDADNFLAQVNRCFFIVQQAWTELKPDMSRQVMADGIWQQHRMQIEQYRSLHKRNVLENLYVRNVGIVGAHSDKSYDTVTVRIDAACADYEVDTQKNKYIKGNRDVEDWAEDWIFQRSSKATTKASGGTLSQKCPNCGAPLNVDLAGVCGYCRAPVMSGAYDWVLTRIDQI